MTMKQTQPGTCSHTDPKGNRCHSQPWKHGAALCFHHDMLATLAEWDARRVVIAVSKPKSNQRLQVNSL